MLRLHRIALAAGLGMVLTCSILVDTVHAAPHTSTTLKSSYTVVNGDYLSGIAMKLNVKVKDLLTANHLRLDSLIVPGMQLVVPGGSARSAVAVSTPASSSPAPFYTVANGDYLSGIADTLGVSIRSLLTANHLSLNSLIFPGMRLVVPKGGQVPAAAAGATASAATSAASARRYTVRNGDSLSVIAQQLGVSLVSLLAVNQLSASSLIYPGMQLMVPKGAKVVTKATEAPAPTPSSGKGKQLHYTVVNGDYLAGIAAKLGVTLPSLLTTNRLTVKSFISPGMSLLVPKGGTLPASSAATGGSKGAPLSPSVSKVLAFARAQIGKPYKFNMAGPDSFDCSGLVLAAFDTIGITLPHYSGAQMSFGTVIDWTAEPIQPGDLVFLESAPGSGVVNHVGIATSATTWVQAPRTGDVVREGHLNMTRVVGVRRLLGQ